MSPIWRLTLLFCLKMSVCYLFFCLGWWLRASPIGGKVSSLWHILDLKRNNLCKQGPWHPVSAQSAAAFKQGVLCSMEQAPAWEQASQPNAGRARLGGTNFSSTCPITSLEGTLCWTPRSVMHYHLPSSSPKAVPLEMVLAKQGSCAYLYLLHQENEWLPSAPCPGQPFIGTRHADQPDDSALLLWEGLLEISKTKDAMWAEMQRLGRQ